MKKKEETEEEKEAGLASTPLPCSSDLNGENFKPGKEPPPGYEIHLSKSVDIRYLVITTTKQQTFEWPRPVAQVERRRPSKRSVFLFFPSLERNSFFCLFFFSSSI